ncbi:hypothetical protein C0Q70_10891 [Pomacea canaliculata]|uniref:VOC domain-containing protein n=1 Tax=Pomacea canaliculata TaxID=400727 RepID=A0A2T7P4F4_POMCA|nr:hypothetical protein C0Q70_10891 [Pomacea canaliculata]
MTTVCLRFELDLEVLTVAGTGADRPEDTLVGKMPVRMAVVAALLILTEVPWLALGDSDNHLHGIAFISVTTDDIESSLKFYVELLGGMHAQEMSHRFHGDEHYQLFFFKELQEARERGAEPVGVPNIGDDGTLEVGEGFVCVFDNGLVQLMQFTKREGTGQGSAFSVVEPYTSPAYIAAPHLCFWVQDDVDFNHYIAQVEARAVELNLTQVKFNRPVEVHSEAEQRAVPEERLGITFLQGDFSGLSFAYFKGPNGKLYGLFHFGTTTDDLWRSVDFYTTVLGAEELRHPLQGVNIHGDNVEFMLFQKELLDADAWQVAPRELSVANISDSGNMRLDLRFSLFDNYVVETLMYTDGQRLGDPVFSPRHNHSSVAYPS